MGLGSCICEVHRHFCLLFAYKAVNILSYLTPARRCPAGGARSFSRSAASYFQCIGNTTRRIVTCSSFWIAEHSLDPLPGDKITARGGRSLRQIHCVPWYRLKSFLLLGIIVKLVFHIQDSLYYALSRAFINAAGYELRSAYSNLWEE